MEGLAIEIPTVFDDEASSVPSIEGKALVEEEGNRSFLSRLCPKKFNRPTVVVGSVIGGRRFERISIVRVFLELMCILLAFSQAIYIPFDIGFRCSPERLFQPGLQKSSTSLDSISILNLIMDGFFLYMIWSRCGSICVKSQHGNAWLGSYKKLGYLLIDFVAVLPIDLLASSVGELIYFLRLIKLLRLIAISVYIKPILKRIFDHGVIIESNLLTLTSHVIRLVYSGHLFACFFTFVAHVQCGMSLTENGCDVGDDTSSWAVSDNLTGATLMRTYARALWWGWDTVLTLGYGDILPSNELEFFLYNLWQVISLVVTGHVIASFTFAYSLDSSGRAAFDAFVDDLNVFVVNRNIPSRVKAKIDAYFEYEWKHRKGLNEQELINQLPRHLRREASRFIHGANVAKVELWQGMSESFCSNLANAFQLRLYSPGDMVFAEGSAGQELFVMSVGIAHVLENNVKAAVIREGMAFGELGLFELGHKRPQGVKAVTFCEVYCLSRAAFDAVSKVSFGSKSPQYQKSMEKRAFAAGSFDYAKRNGSLIYEGHGEDDDDTDVDSEGISGVRTTRRGRIDSTEATPTPHASTGAGSWRLPKSPFRRYWNLLSAIIVLYYLIAIPYRMAFLEAQWYAFFHGSSDYKYYWLWFIIDQLCNLFFMVDIVLLSCCFGFEYTSKLTGEKLVVMDRASIWKHYLRTGFLLDFVSALPYNAFAFLIAANIVWPLSLLRIIRLRRFNAYWNDVFRLLHERSIVSVKEGTKKLLSWLLAVVLITHIAACAWYYAAYASLAKYAPPIREVPISNYECLRDVTCNWLRRMGLVKASMWDRYVESIYWSMDIVSLTGYGDIVPFTMAETWCVALWTILSGVVYYGIEGHLAAIAKASRAIGQNFHEQVEAIEIYVDNHGLSKRLLHDIKQHYNFVWNWRKGIDDEAIYASLSASLRDNLKKNLFESLIRGVYLFSGCDEQFVKAIISKVEQRVYLKGDYIIREGDASNILHMIQLGRVQILDNDNVTCIAGLSEGTCFGDNSLIDDTRSAVFVQAVTFCNVIELSKTSFDSVAHTFPDISKLVVDRAAKQRVTTRTIRTNVAANFERRKIKKMNVRQGTIFTDDFETSRSVFAPNSKFRRTWDVALWMVIMYNAIIVPLRFAFDGPSFQIQKVVTALLIGDIVSDVLLVLDIYLKCFHFGYFENGQLVASRSMIFKSYRKSGYLRYDLLASLPLYWLTGNIAVLTALRLPRLLRVIQLGRYFTGIEEFLSELNIRISVNFFIFIRLLASLVLYAHVFGCTFYWIGLYDVETGSDSWLISDNMQSIDVPLVRKYFRSLYWALGTLTGLSCGDIVPKTKLEIAVFLLCVTVSFFSMSTVLGTIGSLLVSFNRLASRQQQIVDNFHKFATRQNLPKVLRMKALQFHEYHFFQTKGIDSVSVILDKLPLNLRRRVVEEQYMGSVQSLYMFQGFPSCLLRDICDSLKPQFYLPGDVIVYQGDIGHSLFIMQHGKGELITADDKCIYASLGPGSVVGEIPFFLPERRQSVSARVVSHAEFLVLGRDSWLDGIRGFDALQQQVQDRCAAKARANKVIEIAVRTNLISAVHDKSSKLFKLLGSDQQPMSQFRRHLRIIIRGVRAMLPTCVKATRRPKPSSQGRLHRRPVSAKRKMPSPYAHQAVTPVLARVSARDETKVDFARIEESSRMPSKTMRSDDKMIEMSSSSGLGLLDSIAASTSGTVRPIGDDKTSLLGTRSARSGVLPRRSSKSFGTTLMPSDSAKDAIHPSFLVNGKSAAVKMIQVPIWIDSGTPWNFGHPSSLFRAIWTLLGICATLYHATVIPFRICFMEDNDPLWAPLNDTVRGWMAVEQVLMVYFFLQIVLHWNFFQLVEGGEVISDPSRISDDYVKNWLLLDTLIMIPFHWVPHVQGDSWRTLTLLKINKLLLLVRLPRFLTEGEAYLSHQLGVRIRPATIRFFKAIFSLLLLSHWIACIWYLVGMESGGFISGWMSFPDTKLLPQGHSSILARWQRSMYYALNLTTTTQTGATRPLTTLETVYTICVDFLAMSAFSIVICCIEDMIRDKDQAQSTFELRLKRMDWYLKKRKFPGELLSRINAYHWRFWKKQKGVDPEETLHYLPISLRTEIALHMHSDIVECEGIFGGCEQAFVDAIAVVLKLQHLVAGDVLIRQGEAGSEMYFVRSGLLEEFDNERTWKVRRRVKEFFGQRACLLGETAQSNVEALEDCDLLVLHQDDYENVLKLYPEYREFMKNKWITSSIEGSSGAGLEIDFKVKEVEELKID